MSNNINKYSYWLFESIINKSLCEEIIKFGISKNLQKAWVGNKHKNKLSKKELKEQKKIRKSNVSFFSEPWIYEELNQIIHLANRNAGWNYDWDYNEACQFTEYKKGQFYNWHCDNYQEPYKNHPNPKLEGKMRKLSLTLQLSDPKDYSGGELQFDMTVNKDRPHRETLKNSPQGTIVVFPSFIEHTIKPVKKGVRYSLVNWSCGYPWK
jgi:PKHD-type hydroxylase